MRRFPFVKRTIVSVLCVALLLTGNLSTMATEVGELLTEVTETTETMKGEAVVATETESESETENETETETETETEIESEIETESEQEEAKTVNYTYENDDAIITVSAEEGALPSDAKLSVAPITSGDEYQEVKSQLESDAEENDYKIAGFLAYDICFLVDGEEVEPNGEVSVVIDYKEAAIPKSVENAENATVSVMHMEEKNTDVEVKDITSDSAINTTSENAVEKVEFVTDSFSTFTVTWKYYGSSKLNIKIHYYDITNKNEDIQGAQTSNITISENSEVIFSTYANKISGYKYVKAAISKDGSNEVTKAYASTAWSWDYWTNIYKVTLYNGDEEITSISNKSNNKTINVYLLYEKEKTGLSIIDNVMENGTLSVESSLNDVSKYVWYKSVNDGEFIEVERQKFKNGDYSVSEDGTSVNVVLSEGALDDNQTSVKYKVVALSESGEEIASSEEYEMEYYKKVQNGSFETPVNKDCNSSVDQHDAMHQFLYSTHPEVIWKATASGVHDYSKGPVELEIITTLTSKDRENVKSWYNWYCGEYDYRNPTYNDYSAVKAADGDQFAEINCEAEAALYQDVLTVKGQELNYWLSHRARGTSPTSSLEYDTMYVVIMPTLIAKTKGDNGGEVDTQAELTSIMGSHKNDANISEGIYLDGEYSGTYIRKITSDDQAWHNYQGTYNVSSYMTRFFFVAGSTSEIASGNNTVGNFVDNIGFSQELPPAADGKFDLEIRKTISGVDEEDIDTAKAALEFAISADDTNAPLNNKTIKGTDEGWTWTVNSGDLEGVYSLKDNTIDVSKTYVYTIKENEETAALNGYELTASQDVISSSKINNSSATIKEKSSAIFTFTNIYEKNAVPDIKTSTRELNKTAHVNSWDDRTYDITLDATVFDTVTKSQTKPINVALVFDASNSMLFPSDLEEVKNVNNLNQLDTSKDYFYVGTDNSATVYRIYYQNNQWKYVDASYSKDDSRAKDYTFTSEQTIYYSTTGKTRLDYLKASTCELISSLPAGSVVSLVTFNNAVYVYNFAKNASESYSDSAVANYRIEITEENRSQLINAIEGIKTLGGTRQDWALATAKDVMENAFSTNRDSYVIFLTDGCPNCSDVNKAKSDAIKTAEKIKKNATIYSVGIDLDLNNQMSSAKELMQAAASSGETYKNIKSNDLDDTFKALTKEITKSEDVAVTYSVKDYIDDCFEIADEKQIASIGGTIDKDDHGTYVVWNDISQTKKWEKTFTVVAKEDYVGGNAVTTNKERSGVFVVDEDPRYFDNPVVNVKPELTIEDAETTIFLGEKVPFTSEIIEKMTTRTDGKWYSDKECQNEIDITTFEAYPTETVVYYQKLTERFGNPTEKSNINTDGHTAGDADTYELSVVGTYTVNVVSGELSITKKSQSTEEPLGGATYQLKMTNQTGGILYETTSVSSTDEDANKGEMVFSKLPIGEYELVETVAPAGYSLSGNVYKVVVSANGITVTLDNETITSDVLTVEESLRNLKAEFDVLDVVLYSLPETGGVGIFAYMFGGMFLMMAGALYIFVCRRKAYRA